MNLVLLASVACDVVLNLNTSCIQFRFVAGIGIGGNFKEKFVGHVHRLDRHDSGRNDGTFHVQYSCSISQQ